MNRAYDDCPDVIAERVHSPADSAGDGPEREDLYSEHRLECAKWNYDADYATEPCTCGRDA